MKQNLQLKMSQNLALTPQLQQSIRLLQLSTLELNQELESILEENPLLELVDGENEFDGEDKDNAESATDTAEAEGTETVDDATESSASDAQEISNPTPEDATVAETPISDDDFTKNDFDEDYEEYGSASSWDEAGKQSHNNDDDDDDFTRQETVERSLREHLLDQLKLLKISERDQKLMQLLIDSINENGYLEAELEEIVEALPEELEVEFVAEHLQLLANKDFNKLRKLLNCTEDTLRSAQALIQLQNPRPGADFAQFSPDHFIQHEVVVKKVKGIWVATLNDGVMPKLRINQLYANILKGSKGSSGQYLQNQMQEARWMIKNIQQRFSTILRVSQAIVDRQRNFFEHGEIAMRPLVLREIAEELELHESTISRVTTHKYMLTPRGIFELKYFFGSHVSTETGGECSATAIRALIKQLVAEEDTKKPLSDNKISEILAKQGIKVARRTIAKYRESLNIPPANLRKSL